MVDTVDKQTRSRMMARIRGKDTRPEIKLRKALHAMGLRFTLHDKLLPGRPDIVLPKWNAVIEVYGCFWHRHPGCKYATTPSTRPAFWAEKFATNVARDRRNIDKLRSLGWRTTIVWECQLRGDDIDELVTKLYKWIRSNEPDHGLG